MADKNLELKIEDVAGKMTWHDVVRHYKPEATDEEIAWLIWNETCYPFDNETTLRQINSYFNPQIIKP